MGCLLWYEESDKDGIKIPPTDKRLAENFFIVILLRK